MAQKALAQLRAAEAEAEQIRSAALERAEAMRKDAHSSGKSLLADNTVKLRALCKAKTVEADTKAAAVIESGTQSANEEAKQLTQRASAKMDAATALILERIRTLWQ